MEQIRIEHPGRAAVLTSEVRKVSPCALVIFGASGDLSRRKLMPAIYNLARDGALPESFNLIGNCRSLSSCEEFLGILREAVPRFSRGPFDESVWEKVAPRIGHVTGDPKQPDTHAKLRDRLLEADRRYGTSGKHLFYIATPPKTFLQIIRQLGDSGLLHAGVNKSGAAWPRVLIEKPFGHDLASARRLNDLLAETVHESQIYRIDHYLGKETVQNILVFRFGNSIFEPLWNRKHVDYMEITAAEEIGIGRRGAFYDETGVLRDVVQNHMLQVLALCAMEPPVSHDAGGIRDEKTKVFRQLRGIRGEQARRDVVLGQYRGYRSEPNVAPDSRMPTYAALKVMIDNWRWQGVPFYLRAGKRLATRMTEIAISFQRIPFCLFGRENVCRTVEKNILTIRIQPEEGISLHFATKVPGEDLSVGTVTMDFNYSGVFEGPPPEAYEHLLLGCMRGDQTLFARRDGVELQWQFMTPVLEAWESDPTAPICTYEQGSSGPSEADELLARSGHTWREIK